MQQVASDACNLRIRANWLNRQLWVETDPVRDCSGNAVPDGTVVSFTKKDAAGTTTVDAPIKRGVAKVQMPVTGAARITVASGVATGNETVGGTVMKVSNSAIPIFDCAAGTDSSMRCRGLHPPRRLRRNFPR